MGAVRRPDGRVTGSRRDVLAAAADNFKSKHNDGDNNNGDNNGDVEDGTYASAGVYERTKRNHKQQECDAGGNGGGGAGSQGENKHGG